MRIASSVGVLLAFAGVAAADRVDPARVRVIIVRHGEKPDDGDQLTCQGQNRALQLPAVIAKKFGKPNMIYAPTLAGGTTTTHARMFQTATPLAIKYNLAIDTAFDEHDAAGLAADVKARAGTVLLVWEHSMIPELAKAFGIAEPPKWKGKDFDSIWIIDYRNGAATLTLEREGLNPAADCTY